MAWTRWKRPATLAVKAALAVVVCAYLYRHVARTWLDLNARGGSLHVEPAWLIAGGLLYLAGLAACAVVYARVLNAGASPVGRYAAGRAYLISHLGKYVPGKAMVVVMRVGLSTPYGARASTAAAATFYETLAMMAAGAVVATAGFAVGPRPIQWVSLWVSAGLAAMLLGVVEPRVFPRVAKGVMSAIPNVGPDALPALTWRLLGVGLAWSAVGWVLLGLSQTAVVRAFVPAGLSPALWPLVIASVALATVAGFVVALAPGGLGVREGVLMATLAPAVGEDAAVVSALALRLTWVGAELAAGAVLLPLRPRGPASTSEADANAGAEAAAP
jgi:uncharacterized membrane protein YbhN (UPF0104 family)